MLKPIDLETIKQRHKPLSHQEDAVKAILAAFKTNNRAQAIMACGAGKTHVSLWVAERMKAKRIAVFVPSLALVNQMLHEWLANTEWRNIFGMVICSDDTVTEGIDAFAINKQDCPFPVTTSAIETNKFLKRKFEGVLLVFCTYHSSPVLADAMKNCPEFDLCVFDEAHKTSGNIDKNFSVALDDRNVPSNKRLFMTATPVHYDVHSRDKNGSSKLVYSMDSMEVYGPRAYTLTFREAVKLGIICDYKVLIPIITSDETKKNKRSYDNLNRHVIALQKTIEYHRISKIISFHKSVSEADSFIKYLDSSKHLPQFLCKHVNSKMPVSVRTQEMKAFKIAKKAIISNARCLTEGTNIPAVDMVMFLNRKHSKIDIVQAVGRAMRKHPNKNVGYIFLPLFVEVTKGEDFELAVNRIHYENIWEVLQALAEQDEDLLINSIHTVIFE